MSFHAPLAVNIPGSDLPQQTSRTARLRRIRAQVNASAEVIDLLTALAFGDDPEAGWPDPAPFGHTAHGAPLLPASMELAYG